MKKIYKVAVVPMDIDKGMVVVLDVSLMTLPVAEKVAKFYNDWYGNLIKSYRCDVVVAFNMDACKVEDPFALDIFYESAY